MQKRPSLSTGYSNGNPYKNFDSNSTEQFHPVLYSLAKNVAEMNRISLLLATNRVGFLKFWGQSLRFVAFFLISDCLGRNLLHANRWPGFAKQNSPSMTRKSR